MSRFDTKPEDYDKAVEDGERASESGSMFIQKRLKTTLDHIYIVFLEIPRFGTVVYDGNPSEKGQANVVSFGNDGSQCEEGVFILEMAPLHINRFLAKLRKPQYGLAKLYEIERHGLPKNTKTYYELEIVRDLTDAEINYLEGVEMHPLFTRQATDTDTTPAPPTGIPPPAPVVPPPSQEFNARVGIEMKRLDWSKENMLVAIKTYFQGAITKGSEMNPGQQEAFIGALQRMAPGDAPAGIGYQETGEPLDLDEDTVNFF